MVKVQSFVCNDLQENSYVLWDDTLQAVIIDPGCYTKQEEESIATFIKQSGLTINFVLNTHCHADHVLGNAYFKETYKVPLLIPENELSTLRAVKSYASVYGFYQYQEAIPDKLLKATDVIQFGNTTLNILYVPGHSPGHIAFYHAPSNLCWAGDVLFYRSIGRTDLPGGDHSTLLSSIRHQIFNLPDHTMVYPGHGPATNVGDEKKLNPYLK